ncbi:MAG: serine/threonine-protein kinase [Myxococcota bacterium]
MEREGQPPRERETREQSGTHECETASSTLRLGTTDPDPVVLPSERPPPQTESKPAAKKARYSPRQLQREPAQKDDGGDRLDDRYRLECEVGQGDSGIVYRARHLETDRQVAVKVLQTAERAGPNLRQRFLREARIVAAIDHPNIVKVSDFGITESGTMYFAMEYIDGRPLSKLLGGGVRMEPSTMISIGTQICRGLDAVHCQGIVHRDLTPDNILVVGYGRKMEVKVVDFGIAKIVSDVRKLTQAGSICGTPSYLSPEQASGTEVDSRSDIYSLGTVLYEAATGIPPFVAEGSITEVLRQHRFEAPVAPSLLRTEGRPLGHLEEVMMRCLEKDPDHRYQTMRELEQALEGHRARSSERAAENMPWFRFISSRKALWVFGALTALALTVAGLWALYSTLR